VRGSVVKGLAAALVVAAVFVPGESAKTANPLALLPLPHSALGAPAASLDISRPSGGKSFSGRLLRQLGRLSGYQLTYGNFFIADPAGLSMVQTGIDQYTTAYNAQHALPFWKKRALHQDDLTRLDLTTTIAPLVVAGITQPHWATLQTFSVTGYGSQFIVKVELSDSNYVLDVTAQAGTQDLATSFAISAAQKLDKRLNRWLSGHLHGTPVALPPYPDQGPPASGPDPATMMLQTGDFAPTTYLDGEGYDLFPAALSTYTAYFSPAGPFDEVYQSAMLMPSSNSAAYVDAVNAASSIYYQLEYSKHAYVQVTPVDVTAVGDEAQAEIVTISSYGYTRSNAVITLHSGAAADIIYAYGHTPLKASDVQALAQAAADRLDAAV
jgi:hypothetical protein